MFGRRGIELSLNFLVIIIISIVVFAFGVRFIYNLSSQAMELKDITTSELDEKIGNLVCEGSDRVCIGTDRKTISVKKFDTFGLKIINILNSQHFLIKVTPSNPMGYTKSNQPIQASSSFNGLEIAPLVYSNPGRDVLLQKNEEKVFGIGIQVPANAVPGVYIFNVNINSQDGNPYTSTQKFFVDVT